MAGPTIPEILSRLLAEDRISRDDYSQFLGNYEFFQSRAAQIRQDNGGRWVAALNEELYTDNHGRRLIARMLSARGGRYAYIEQIL